MKLFQAYYLLIFLSLRVASQELGRYAKQGCNETCGNNVMIPYPFGIGAECAVNEWYVVGCNSSKPYLHHELNRFEIIGVNLINQTITVNTPKPIFSDCQNLVSNITQTNTINLGRSPFLLSTLDNIFVFEGCGNAVMMDHGSSVVSGCSTFCLNDSTLSDRNNNCLFGINCCQTTIPRYLKSYNIRLIMDMEKQGRERACGSAFVMETSSYINRSFSNSQSSIGSWEDTFVPISLLWTLSENDYDRVTCCTSINYKNTVIVPLDNGTSVDSWKCSTPSSYKGNPYLKDGCYDARPTDDHCTKCRANGTVCDYNLKEGYHCIDYNNIDYYYKHGKSLDLGVILEKARKDSASEEMKRTMGIHKIDAGL